MSENAEHNYSSTCARLTSRMQEVYSRIKLGEQNAKLKATYDTQLHKHERNIELCNEALNTLKPLIDDTEDYSNRRRTEALQNINNALRMAGEIIYDADDGIKIRLDGDEAFVVTGDDRTVQNTEGGAFRHISSTFLQAVMLQTNQDLLQTLMLDEMFAQVNAENTAKLSLYLNAMSQNMQIICIEQKPEIKSNVDTLIYHFKKGEDFADVEKTFVKAGTEIKSVDTEEDRHVG